MCIMQVCLSDRTCVNMVCLYLGTNIASYVWHFLSKDQIFSNGKALTCTHFIENSKSVHKIGDMPFYWECVHMLMTNHIPFMCLYQLLKHLACVVRLSSS